ncbi:MAG: SMC-Scp complex subunit ScpB [Planctomycetes bacterium]|nr:SMC-Scp complex subunit ScpB [Planctomycetota bacterium]
MPHSPDEPVAPPEPPLTIKRLTAALAEMLGPPGANQPDDTQSTSEIGAPATMSLADADECCPITPQSILEALLFVGRPGAEGLRTDQVAEWIRDFEPAEVEETVAQLNAQYSAEGAPYTIISDRGGFRLALTADFQQIKRRLSGRSREARLSQAAVEVLALVAYNQPIVGTEVSRLRGKPSGHLLTNLVRRQLLRIERKPEGPRSPLYHTTPRFLALFGLSDIAELPQTQELEQ